MNPTDFNMGALNDTPFDDTLPNNGEAFHADEDSLTDDEQADLQADREEAHMMKTAGTHLTDRIIEWFDAEIAATDSVRAVKALAESLGKDEVVVLEAANIVRIVLEQKREDLIALKEQHLS